MPRYSSIRFWKDETTRGRAIERLLALRKQLQAEVIPHRSDSSFLLATWNIRDFDSNKFGHGPRQRESFHYIAEIISSFDLVAVQEVNRNLSALEKVLNLLGGKWDYIVTDATEGPGGNDERLAFVYDTRKIWFRNIAGEVVLKEGQKIVTPKEVKADAEGEDKVVKNTELQFARTPFVAAFQAGWFKFNLCTVHIYFGADTGTKYARRTDEIAAISKFFKDRQKREKEDYILLGDFNIVSPDDATMKGLNKNGFKVPENLLKEKTNLGGDKHYDQIALRVANKKLQIGASGVFDYRKTVFRDGDYDAYFDVMPPNLRDIHDSGKKKGQPRSDAEKRAYYRDKWRTWQMSDHLPMWVELKVDFTEDYLRSLKPGATPIV